jgi:hypothetical protein
MAAGTLHRSSAEDPLHAPVFAGGVHEPLHAVGSARGGSSHEVDSTKRERLPTVSMQRFTSA